MKVCIVVPYDLTEQGGVKRHAFQLAAALRELGDHVTSMGASSGRSDDPAIHVFGGIVNIRSNGSDNRLAILTSPWRIRQWLHAGGFDVVHVHEPLCPLLAPWATLFAGTAARVATFHAYAEHEGAVPRALRWCTAPVVLRELDRAIAVSEPAASYARFVWKRELAIIPNGITLDDRPGAAATPRRDEGGPLRMLFVGHWRDERKGLSVLLDAYRALRARGTAVTLDVVGSGPTGVEPPAIEGVRFHGEVASERGIAERLEACDLFVAPSLGQESFGIVLLEAMAAARPIVCSEIAGFKQVVGARNARMVTAGSVDELAAAIAQLAADPEARRAMSLANRERVKQFAWSSLVHRVRDEYVGAIAARQRRGQAAS